MHRCPNYLICIDIYNIIFKSNLDTLLEDDHEAWWNVRLGSCQYSVMIIEPIRMQKQASKAKPHPNIHPVYTTVKR